MLPMKEEQNDQGVNWIASTVSYLLVGFILSGTNKRMSGRGLVYRSRVNKAIRKSKTRRFNNFRRNLFQSKGNIRSILLGLQRSPSTNETQHKLRMLEGYLRRFTRKSAVNKTKNNNNDNNNVNEDNDNNNDNDNETILATPSPSNTENQGGGKRKTHKRKLRR